MESPHMQIIAVVSFITIICVLSWTQKSIVPLIGLLAFVDIEKI